MHIVKILLVRGTSDENTYLYTALGDVNGGALYMRLLKCRLAISREVGPNDSDVLFTVVNRPPMPMGHWPFSFTASPSPDVAVG